MNLLGSDVASTRALAHAPWSASKVQTALRCPRLFYYRYVAKLKEPETMPETRIGKAVHAVLEQVLQGILLPQALAEGEKDLEPRDRARYLELCTEVPEFVKRIELFRHRQRVRRQWVEYSIALRRDLSPTAFYARDAYYRGVLDVAYLFGDGELALVDHKTGAPYPHLTIADQLEGYAVLAASAFSGTRRVWLGVHWVRSGTMHWGEPMTAAEINQRLLPQVMDTIEAAALAVEDGPRQQPSSWCLRCSYRSVCPTGQSARFEPVIVEPEPWET